MKKLGIIGAMNEEVDGITAALNGEVSVTNFCGTTVYFGSINGIDVVVARSGIGKVNAAFITSALCEKYGIDGAIMTGIAGGIGLKTHNIVIPDGFVQHDVIMPGEVDGHIDILDAVVLPADKRLSEGLRAEAEAPKCGLIATGEAFVSDADVANGIKRRFPGVVAVDMECGAVAQVCARMRVPFAAIKIIADGCDAGDYFDFKNSASKLAISTVVAFLRKLKT